MLPAMPKLMPPFFVDYLALVDAIPCPKVFLLVVEEDCLINVPVGLWGNSILTKGLAELVLVVRTIEAHFDFVWIGLVGMDIVHRRKALPAIFPCSCGLLGECNLISPRLVITLRT